MLLQHRYKSIRMKFFCAVNHKIIDPMMSKKCKYALKALIRLGKEYGGGNLLTDDIAKSALLLSMQ